MRVEDVRRAFTRKLGAAEDRGRHHIYYYFDYEGSEYTVGKISHSWRGSLNDTQVDMLAKKLFLERREFESFVDCTLSTEEMIGCWQSRRPRFQHQ